MSRSILPYMAALSGELPSNPTQFDSSGNAGGANEISTKTDAEGTLLQDFQARTSAERSLVAQAHHARAQAQTLGQAPSAAPSAAAVALRGNATPSEGIRSDRLQQTGTTQSNMFEPTVSVEMLIEHVAFCAARARAADIAALAAQKEYEDAKVLLESSLARFQQQRSSTLGSNPSTTASAPLPQGLLGAESLPQGLLRASQSLGPGVPVQGPQQHSPWTSQPLGSALNVPLPPNLKAMHLQESNATSSSLPPDDSLGGDKTIPHIAEGIRVAGGLPKCINDKVTEGDTVDGPLKKRKLSRVHEGTARPQSRIKDKNDSDVVDNKHIKMPRRPLSAYNLFFSQERERILSNVNDSTTALENVAVEDDQPVPDISQVKLEDIPLIQRLNKQHMDNSKKQRRHRKTHGKIGFRELSKLVGERWRELSAERKDYFKALAKMDLARYKAELAELGLESGRS